MRRTKIVATVGPATDSKEKIKELITAGVNVFRLNFSHGNHEDHASLASLIRGISDEMKKPIAILQDISGPKIRIGQVKGSLDLHYKDTFKLIKGEADGTNSELSLSYPDIIDDLEVGTNVFFADGTLQAEAIKKDENSVTLSILVGGKLTSRKGVNFPGTNLGIGAITPKDRADLIFGAKLGVDLVAVSFVQHEDDIHHVRQILKDHNSDAWIFAKIEMQEAIANLEAIITASDGVMVARGDLGVELGMARVPVAQKRIIKMANHYDKPVITATQMLTSMLNSPYPTRAEVSDIANAVLDGTDAVMLSDETAVGNYPIKAIETLDETIRETETIYPHWKHNDKITLAHDAIASSVSTLAKQILPDGILVFTASGATALSVSKFRPKAPIYINTTSTETFNRLCVVWGVVPTFTFDPQGDSDELIYDFVIKAEKCGIVKAENQYILTMGFPLGKTGTTNMMRVIDSLGITLLKEQFEKS
jgi:pyruvate kinase